MMFQRKEWALALLVIVAVPAAAQETRQEFKSELDFYVNEGSRSRLIFQEYTTVGEPGQPAEGSFAGFFEVALRPVFRRELRAEPDVFRSRYLTFRAGYQYKTSLSSGDASSENRGVAELTARYRLPAGIVIIDRNRGDFRFVKGQAFSTRYRNRLWVERDTKLRSLAVTPYVYDEIYYDTRYDAWSTNRLSVGVQVPVGPHLVVEPFFLYGVNSRGSTHRTEQLGIRFSLYF
jgi:hypothetical protein